MTRGRRPTTGVQERAWLRRHRELLARDAKRVPPMPDPKREPREFLAWAEAHGQRELSAEQRKLYDELRELPRVKFSMAKARDREVWGWIYHLLVRQGQGAPYDLRTCKLGANPANPNAQPSKMLRCLVATVAQEYPTVDACRLYDAIRHWRRSVSTI